MPVETLRSGEANWHSIHCQEQTANHSQSAHLQRREVGEASQATLKIGEASHSLTKGCTYDSIELQETQHPSSTRGCRNAHASVNARIPQRSIV
eukprot:scaffold302060_cov17-Tisochrysis_lutea.AAC.1